MEVGKVKVAVMIERNDANPFIMIINHFDTVPEIKMKIHRITGIPISQQTLIFRGEILTNDFDILRYNIDKKSRIQLVVNKEFPAPANHPLKKTGNEFSPPATPPAKDYPLNNAAGLDFDRELKLVQEMLKRYRLMTTEKEPEKPTPPSLPRGVYRDDILTSLRKFPEAAPAAVTKNEFPAPAETEKQPEVKIGFDVFERKRRPDTKKEGPLRVEVVFEGERTQVLVHKEHSVWSLREKLDVMQMEGLFDYPGYPFYFFHRLDVMKDDKSFEWHQVDQGDDIHIISAY